MKKVFFISLCFISPLLCRITGSSYIRKENRLSRSRHVNKPYTSIFGDLVTGERIDSFNIIFQSIIPTDLTISSTSNGGSVFQANSMANISSGTNSSGQAFIKSRGALHYLSGHEAYVYFTSAFERSTDNSTQWAGLLNDTNGIGIGFNGTKFSTIVRNDGVETITPRESFNLDILDGTGISGININTTQLNIFKISYGWLGAAPITFEICREDGVWFPFHKLNYPNLHDKPSIGHTSLPMKIEVKKIGADSTNLVVKSASWCMGTVGFARHSFQREYQYSVKSKPIKAGTMKPILSIKNKLTFFGEENTETAVLIFSGLATRPSSKGLGRFLFLKNANLTNSNWVDRDPQNSFIQYDTESNSYTGGEEVFDAPVVSNTHKNIFFLENGVTISIYPGETLTIVASPDTNTTVDTSIIWREVIS